MTMTDKEKRALHDAGATHTYQSADELFNAPIAFNVNDATIAEIAEQCKEVDAYKNLAGAKLAKKVLTKMRTTLGDAHKEAKSGALEYGRKVDAEKNRLLVLIREIEDPISKDLDDIKNEAALKEAERVQHILTHIERLQSYALDRHTSTLEELQAKREALAAEELTEEVYQERLEDAQLTKDEADMKLRITIQNEKERIEQEEAQRMAAEENQRLADELAERQAAMDAEDVNRKEKQAAADAERRKIDDADAAKRKAEQDKIAAEQAAAQKIIDDENARIAQEAADKAVKEQAERDEEERKNLEAEAEARAIEQAPDRDKLLLYADAVDHLIKVKPTLATDVASEVLLQAVSMLIEVAYDIRKQTEEMK
jgi:hypothetical protein